MIRAIKVHAAQQSLIVVHSLPSNMSYVRLLPFLHIRMKKVMLTMSSASLMILVHGIRCLIPQLLIMLQLRRSARLTSL